MKQPQKDIVIFGSIIFGYSILCIWVAVSYDLQRGLIVGGIIGIGILLCVGVRQFMKESSQSFTEVMGK